MDKTIFIQQGGKKKDRGRHCHAVGRQPAMTRRDILRGAMAAALLLGGAAFGASSLEAQTAGAVRLKEAKVAFDITAGEAKRLLSILNVIDETRETFVKQGVTPRFVLAFRGPATLLVQSNQEKIKPEDRETVQKIATKLKQLKAAPGVESVEQCSVAMRLVEVKKEHVMPELTIVENSWVTLIGYQARGYAYIAP